MENYVFGSGLQEKLGFSKTIVVARVFGNTKKELLSDIKTKKNSVTVYGPHTEELLRFAIERVPVDIILGVEGIHPKDSVHFVRGGLDHVLCRLAKKNGKTIGFSFADVLNSKNKARLMSRMSFNYFLCKKYGVKTVFSTFASKESELRSAADLKRFVKTITTKKK